MVGNEWAVLSKGLPGEMEKEGRKEEGRKEKKRAKSAVGP